MRSIKVIITPLSLHLALSLVTVQTTQSASFRSLSDSQFRKNLQSSIPLSSQVGLSEHHSFNIKTQVPLANGKVKIRYQQHYQGIPIYDGAVSATRTSNGKINKISGEVLDNIEADLPKARAGITQKSALSIALKQAKLSNSNRTDGNQLQDYHIENTRTRDFIHLNKAKKARRVYEVSMMIHTQKGPSRPFYLIDAKTGNILEHWNGLTTHKMAHGPGGNEKTGIYEYGEDFNGLPVSEDCAMSSKHVDTINMNHKRMGGDIHQFACPSNTHKAINGAFSPLNDAHYFGNVVFNMYQDWFKTSPLTHRLAMRVHYDSHFENAFWDGKQMTFGDGNSRFYPLVSLDVVAHEVSHGFTEQNSDLMYRSQAGGINESFSDMAGEAAEYYMHGENDWLIGSSISKTAEALRYMDDPTKDERSIGHKKDYSLFMNVHHTSGVFNKAFYELANTENWNTAKAFKPFVLANQVYWKRISTFHTASCGVINAGKDLGYDSTAIENAFKKVGVKCKSIFG